jgi:hypothetical protein
VIPGYNLLTPRSGFEALLKEVKNKVQQKSLTFVSIWNITKKTGDEPKKSKEEIKIAFLKYVTDISEELMNEIIKQMPMALVTKEEYLTFFGEKDEVKKEKKAIKADPNAVLAPAAKREQEMNQEKRAYWIAKFSSLIEKNNLKADEVF